MRNLRNSTLKLHGLDAEIMQEAVLSMGDSAYSWKQLLQKIEAVMRRRDLTMQDLSNLRESSITSKTHFIVRFKKEKS